MKREKSFNNKHVFYRPIIKEDFIFVFLNYKESSSLSTNSLMSKIFAELWLVGIFGGLFCICSWLYIWVVRHLQLQDCSQAEIDKYVNWCADLSQIH